MSLTTKIFIAIITGIVLGSLVNLFVLPSSSIFTYLINGLLFAIGKIYISSLKMMVVPLVFVSLVNGIMSLTDLSTLGRMSIRAITLYMTTTALAISIALLLAFIISPGQGSNFETNNIEYAAKEAPPLIDTFIDIVPANILQAMASSNMLQIIFFAILFGIAIANTTKNNRPILDFFQSLDQVIMTMVEIIMKFAPYGVFALITTTFATQGFDLIFKLLAYFFTLTAALFIHMTVTYSLFLTFFAKLNPLIFFRKIREVFLFAFSTASSGATIPVTLRTVEKKLGVNNNIASFTVPLGATINMDGTAMMQGVATVFIANVYQIDLGLTDYLMVILTATLASIGTASVPGVGLITLVLVLQQVGLPIEGIALIMGIDRLIDMMRTAVNVTGDCMVTCCVAKKEKALDERIFNQKEG